MGGIGFKPCPNNRSIIEFTTFMASFNDLIGGELSSSMAGFQTLLLAKHL